MKTVICLSTIIEFIHIKNLPGFQNPAGYSPCDNLHSKAFNEVKPEILIISVPVLFGVVPYLQGIS